ncbi:MAG: hypothetical protein IPQ07_29325 [Myxococcales bacterium]|nr:hypothetical protein [Myxococcales bacterium]
MRSLPCLGATLTFAIGACGGGGGGGGGGDDVAPGDAKRLDAAVDITELSGDFTCMGTAWPTTAPDPLSVIGRVTDPVTMANGGGATVELHKASDDALIVMGAAATNGIFAFNLATAGVAPTIYRKATLAGSVDGYTYDPYAPFDGSHAGRGIYAPTPASRDSYYTAAGLANDPAKGTVLVEIFDCLDLQVYGATIEAPGAAKIIYVDDSGAPSGTATSTGSPGIAVVLGAPPGPIAITVHAGSVVFRAWPVTSRANAFVYSPRLP